MRKLFGFACHLASVRLHEAAATLLDWDSLQGPGWHAPPKFMQGLVGSDHRYIELSDVAPRLAAAVEVIGDRVQHAKWLAGIVGLERMVKESDRGS